MLKKLKLLYQWYCGSITKSEYLLNKYDIPYRKSDSGFIINEDLDFNLPYYSNDFLKDCIINGDIYLCNSEKFETGFLSNTIINGRLEFHFKDNDINVYIPEEILSGCVINNLIISGLFVAPKNFLKNTIIRGTLSLPNLRQVDSDFLSGCTIGNLYLSQLKFIDAEFLSNTTITGNLHLGLEDLPKGFRPNVGRYIDLGPIKSNTLKELILYPGINRQLGFNLIKNYDKN